MKKQGFLLVISVMCMALLSSCASNADTMPAPISTGVPTTGQPTSTTAPAATAAPTQTTGMTDMMGDLTQGLMPDADMGAGVNTVEDALRVSDRVSEEVEKLSELDMAEAVVAGNIALVGVSYDAQYQGGLTQRLEDMVKERVETIDKAITAVHVTDDEEQMKKIAQLREKLKTGGITFEQLQTQVLDIGSSITGGGSPQISQPQSSTGT